MTRPERSPQLSLGFSPARPSPPRPLRQRAGTADDVDPARSGDADAFATLRQLIRAGGPQIVFQPQLSLSRLEVVGYEALARFPASTRPPEHWFATAHQVGLGPAMEACALANALRTQAERPAGTLLAVNLSPSVLGSPALRAVLPYDLSGIEIELTEHESVRDTDGLRRELDLLRDRGARLAIDDVGAGHSGLRRMMELGPDCLKLDRHLVEGVACSREKAALIRAVVDFADHIGAAVCAEGVETVSDTLALADLDVDIAQGWAVGPADTGFRAADPVIVAACGRSMQRVLTTPRPDPPDDPDGEPTMEDLLGRLADVRDLDGLAALAGAGAAVLPCDRVELSFLHDDGSAVECLIGEAGPGDGLRYRLADYPATRECLERRVVIPVYSAHPGDAAERRLLTDLGFASVLLVPVSSRGRIVGLLECFLLVDTPWSRRQIRSARQLASILGPVLDGLLGPRGR